MKIKKNCIISFIILLITTIPLSANYRVILKDGKTLISQSKPVVMEGNYRFRTEDNVFQIIPINQIDVEATKKANEEKFLDKAGEHSTFNNDSISTGKSVSPSKASAPATIRDNNISDSSFTTKETYWKNRANEFNQKLNSLDKEIKVLEDKIKNSNIILNPKFCCTSDDYVMASWQLQLENLSIERKQLQKEMEEFKEKARKDGALPGWLRDDSNQNIDFPKQNSKINKDESYWRNISSSIRTKIAELDQKITATEDIIKKLQTEGLPITNTNNSYGIQPQAYTKQQFTLADWRIRLENLYKEQTKLKNELENLEEEAHRAGVPPGWLR